MRVRLRKDVQITIKLEGPFAIGWYDTRLMDVRTYVIYLGPIVILIDKELDHDEVSPVS